MTKITFLLVFFTATIYSQCNINISAGAKHTVLLKDDGTIQTWGEGDNGLGALGFGNNLNINTPTHLSSLKNVKKIFTGAASTFVILEDNTLWATGYNNRGQLGNGTQGPGNLSNGFVQIGTASDWATISSDNVQTLGIKFDGTLWGWGSNSNGKLGNGTWIDSYVPLQIGTDTNWKEVSTSAHHTTALKTDGTLWGWGLSAAVANSTTPLQIGTANDWKTISSDCGLHTLALKNDGRLFVFGDIWEINYGTLGLGPTITSAAFPTQIGTDSDWNIISASPRNSFAIKTNGTLWGWGQNSVGNLGDGTQIHRFVPTQISDDTDWQMVSVGVIHTVALKANGDLYTWGSNLKGQLGSGNYVHSMLPLFINSCNLSNEQFDLSQVTLFPNPTTGILTILNMEIDLIKVEMIDSSGRSVRNVLSPTLNTLDLSRLMDGIYILKIQTESGSINEKVILKK